MNTALGEILSRSDVWRGDRLARAAVPALPSGFAPLDAELPGGGWPRGTLTEILADDVGLGECSLLMPALSRMRDEGKWSLLVAPPHLPHGPAWASWGIDPARLAVVSPTRQRDALWAAEQALSSGALGTVLCWTRHTDPRQVRRLQLAVAGSNTLAFLFRPGRERDDSSAAPLRLFLSAGSRGRLAVSLLKRRGPACTRTLYLDVPRPVKWREEHASTSKSDSTLAGAPSAVLAARSHRAVVLA